MAHCGTPVPLNVIVASPVAVIVCEYATPTVPPGRGELVVIVGAVRSTIESACVGVCAALSAACKVKLLVVGVDPLGVPSITPVEA